MPTKKKTTKRLYKSSTNRILTGVIGGAGDYLNVDPVILRVLYVLVTAFTGFVPGVVGYVVLALIVPEK